MTTPKPKNGWTERRKKQQACAIRRWQPWRQSTGPKSEKGKAESRMNAYKHGGYSAARQIINLGLAYHRAFLKHAALYIAAQEEEERQRERAYKRKMKRTIGKASKNNGEVL